MALTPKQQRFVEEYLVDLNATAAAGRAGYAHPNKQGPRLLVNVGVAAAVQAGRAAQQQRSEVTADRVRAEVARLAFIDPRRLFRPDGTLKLPGEWEDDVAAAVASLEFEEIRQAGEAEEELEGQPHGGALKRARAKQVVGQLKKLKLWDKKGSLELLARLMGLLKDQVDVNLNGRVEVVETIVRSRDEASRLPPVNGAGGVPGR